MVIRRFRSASSLPSLMAAALIAMLGGCAQTFDATRLGVPVTLSTAVGQQVDGTRFRVTSRALYAFWGLARIKDASLRKALAAQLVGGSGIANLSIKVRSRWSDVLITALTAGLIVPRAVTYEGVVTGSPPASSR
jgi:hypothetical protein